MIIDKLNLLASAQVVTASAATTDVLDQGAIRDLGFSNGYQVLIQPIASVTAAGAATVQFQLQCATDAAFTTPVTVIQSDAIAKTALVAGGEPIFLPLPLGLDKRYVRVFFNVGTGPLTAGSFTVAIVPAAQKAPAYADALPKVFP